MVISCPRHQHHRCGRRVRPDERPVLNNAHVRRLWPLVTVSGRQLLVATVAPRALEWRRRDALQQPATAKTPAECRRSIRACTDDAFSL